jgi:hypothetical protein
MLSKFIPLVVACATIVYALKLDIQLSHTVRALPSPENSGEKSLVEIHLMFPR